MKFPPLAIERTPTRRTTKTSKEKIIIPKFIKKFMFIILFYPIVVIYIYKARKYSLIMDKIRDLNGPFINSLDNTKYMVIFLHGWGSDGNDLIQLANYWQKDLKNAVFLAPNGPETCNANPLGRQWFDILSEDKSIMYDGIQRACNDLKSYILNNLAKYNLSDNAYFLVGFSQGTMLALHTSLRNKCMGIVGYSGGLVDYKTPSNFELNNTLLLHGKKDT